MSRNRVKNPGGWNLYFYQNQVMIEIIIKLDCFLTPFSLAAYHEM